MYNLNEVLRYGPRWEASLCCNAQFVSNFYNNFYITNLLYKKGDMKLVVFIVEIVEI